MPGIDKLPIEETLEDSPQVREARRGPVGGGQIGPNPWAPGLALLPSSSLPPPVLPRGDAGEPRRRPGERGTLPAAGQGRWCIARCLPVLLAPVAWQGLGAGSGGSRAVSSGSAPCEVSPQSPRPLRPVSIAASPQVSCGLMSCSWAASSVAILPRCCARASGVRVVAWSPLLPPPPHLHSWFILETSCWQNSSSLLKTIFLIFVFY